MTKEKLIRVLEELIKLPKETEWLEFKVNNSDPQSIGEYISALSNSACINKQKHSYLVYGVEDNTHNVVGTDFCYTSEKVGNQDLDLWLNTQLDPHIDFEVHEFEYNNFPIVLFSISPAYNIPIKFKGVEYVRVGANKSKLSKFPEKERQIWDGMKKQSFEENIALQDVSGDTVLELLDYPNYFILMNAILPTNKEAILEKLCEEKIIKRVHNAYDITNLGAILFARDLNSFERLSRKAIRVVVYKGKDRLRTIKEQEGRKGYAVGFQGLIDYVNDKLPSNEEIGSAFRKEVKMYPEIAIRELVANALIHQDFYATGMGPMIEIFEDRIEISNPGKPLISTLRFIDHTPQSRNEQLAKFMRRINICEERGSGIDKVISNIELYQLPAPNFFEYDNSLKVIMYAYKLLRHMDKTDKVRACYQHCVLKYVSNEYMTNQTLRDRFNISEQNYAIASRIISDTIDASFIKLYDPENKSKKYTKYIPDWA